MQAYSKADLYNSYLQKQAAEALETACISKATSAGILEAYPCKLYTPNYFIRVALGLLTTVAVVFSGLLLWLLSSASSAAGTTALLITLAILCYVTLELLVKSKQYYNAGVDNVLMIMVIIFVIASFFALNFQTSWLVISSVTMVVSIWLCIRFTDAFMATVSYCCLFLFVFLFYIEAGDTAKATAPFIMMIMSAVVYFLMEKFIKERSFIYRFCFKAVTVLSLLTFYAAANYFLVRELSIQMFHLQMQSSDPVPFSWLFWMFTLLIPFLYIVYGVIKKNLLVIRTGLALIAVTVFTVRHYYAVFPAEMAMLIAGVILISASYALIEYLKTPKHGYTSGNLPGSKKDALNVEALIVAETFSSQQGVENSGLYGGGSGGGGGATGDY